MHASELFRHLLRDLVGPELRGLGFRGSAPTYRLPNPAAHFALLNFQRSQANTAEFCRFTGNVTFIRREHWPENSWMGKAPTGGMSYPVEGWYQRLGFFLPDPHDTWWTLRAEPDCEPVAEEVLTLVRDEVLPALRRRIAQDQPARAPLRADAPLDGA